MNTTLEAQLSFGFLRLSLYVRDGLVAGCVAESDALDAEAARALAACLVGAAFVSDALCTSALSIPVAPSLGFDAAEVCASLLRGV